MINLKTYKSWILIWLMALITGVGLLVVSIVTTVDGSSNLNKASHQKLYFSSAILPDHSFYPFVVIVERLRLATIPDHDQAKYLIKLAKKRMNSARQLADKGEYQLAEKTLYKAHLYLMKAAQIIETKKEWQSATTLLSNLEKFDEVRPLLKEKINPEDPSLFQQMAVENKVVRDRLINMLQTEH